MTNFYTKQPIDFYTKQSLSWYTRFSNFTWDSTGIFWNDEEYSWDEGIDDDPATGNWYHRI